MQNFIFKSQGLIKNVYIKLETIQTELRHQRVDNAYIMRQLNLLVNDKKLQKQVDEYFKEDEDETSPQTDTDEQ